MFDVFLLLFHEKVMGARKITYITLYLIFSNNISCLYFKEHDQAKVGHNCEFEQDKKQTKTL